MRKILGIIALFILGTAVMAQTVDRPEQPDFPGDLSFDIGSNLFLNSPEFMRTKWWPSHSLGIYYTRGIKLNQHLMFNPSVGFGIERFGFANRVNFLQDSLRRFQFDTLRGYDLQMSKLAITYAEVPFELRYFPVKTIDGDGFFIAIGGVIGARIDAHTKIKYKMGEDNRMDKSKANFGLNDFRYGVQGRIGWKAINFYYKMYLSEIYRKAPYGANPTLYTVGINFTGF